MSSLRDSYLKLTDRTNQGIFDNEEINLALGNIFTTSSIQNVFASSGTLDFVLENPTQLLAVLQLRFVSDSEKFLVETYANPVYSGGTPAQWLNENIGSSKTESFTLLQLPAVTDPGTLGFKQVVRGTSGQGNKSGFTDDIDEARRLIAPGLNILLRVTNLGITGELDLYGRVGQNPV